MKTLQDKVSIITGASAGIGRGIARVFAERGAKLVLASRGEASRGQASGRAVVEEMRAQGASAVHVACDVAKKADAQAMAPSALSEFGRIDILICNAGVFWEQALDDMSEDDWDRAQSTNLKGTFLCVQAVLPEPRGPRPLAEPGAARLQ